MTEPTEDDVNLYLNHLTVGGEFDEFGGLPMHIAFEEVDEEGADGVIIWLDREEIETLYLHLGNVL